MKDAHFDPKEEVAVSWLSGRHHDLVSDLTNHLDIDAGTRDLLLPARHRSLVEAVPDVLNIETGLAAIINASEPGTLAKNTVLDRILTLTDLGRRIANVSATTRLHMRATLCELADALLDILVGTITTQLAWDLRDELGVISAAAQALVGNPDYDLESMRRLVIDLRRDLGVALTAGRPNPIIDYVLRRGTGDFDRDRDRDRTRDLDPDLLDPDLDGGLENDRNRTFQGVDAQFQKRVRDFINRIINDGRIFEPRSVELELGQLAEELEAYLDSPFRSRAVRPAADLPHSIQGRLDDLVRRTQLRLQVRDATRGRNRHRDYVRDRARDRVFDLFRRLVAVYDTSLSAAVENYIDTAECDPRIPRLARKRARELAENLTIVHSETGLLLHSPDLARVEAPARALAERVGGRFEMDVSSAVNPLDTTIFVGLANDFTGADVTTADMANVPLVGVQWSTTTRWPPQDVERIKRNSIVIGEGLYEIRPDTTAADSDLITASR